MRTSAVLLALLLVLLTPPVADAQTPATPQASPSTGVLMQVTLDQLPPDDVATIGVTRTTFATGGSLRAVAGSGPAVYFVEAGTISVKIDDGADPLQIIRAGDSGGSATPQSTETGAEVVLEVGDAFVIPAGASASLQNSAEHPAIVLNLLSAPDAAIEAEEEVTHAVLVRQEVTLPKPPLLVTLALATIPPGDHLSLPDAPVITRLAVVERSQAFSLSGGGTNRGTEPIDVYVLSFTPDDSQG
jgi:quercetin dioxygenase-like cupin family protein